MCDREFTIVPTCTDTWNIFLHIDFWPPPGGSQIVINGIIDAINTSPNGYNSNSFGFVGNFTLLLAEDFGTKAL